MKKWLLLLFLLACLVFVPAQCADRSVEVTILHTNDTHGHLFPHDIAGHKSIGGIGPRASLIREARQQAAENDRFFLLLDIGDINTGEPVSDMFRAEPDILAMNLMGYDAMVMGNHEFDLLPPDMAKQRELARFPYLSANVLHRNTGKRAFTPFIEREFGGLKVAVFGITTENTPQISTQGSNSEWTFVDSKETAREMVSTLRPKADFLIAALHMPHTEVLALAREFQEIDLILSGHTHMPISEPIRVGRTLIAEAGYHGMMVGIWNLRFEDRKLAGWNYRLVGLNFENPLLDTKGQALCPASEKHFGSDPEMDEMLSSYLKKADALLNVPMGTFSEDLPMAVRGSHPKSSPLGNFICDAIRARVSADIVLQNVGGIRADLLKGAATPRAVKQILPFANSIYTFRLTGEQILQVLGATAQRDPGQGGFFEVSGVSFRIWGKALVDVRIDGEPIDLARAYLVATNSFIAKGGDGYGMFPEFAQSAQAEATDTYVMIYDVVIDHISRHSPITGDPTPRMAWIEEGGERR